VETLGGYESTLRDVLFRAIKKFHPDSNGKAPVLNTCYNMERYETYLRKDEDCIDVDTDNFDAELFRLALSDQATQSALQDAQRRKPIGAKWIDHEKRWIERSPDDSSFESAIRYLNWRMCIQRDMEPIINLTKLLTFYISIEIRLMSRILETLHSSKRTLKGKSYLRRS
jgi:hypothetical protein